MLSSVNVMHALIVSGHVEKWVDGLDAADELTVIVLKDFHRFTPFSGFFF